MSRNSKRLEGLDSGPEESSSKAAAVAASIASKNNNEFGFSLPDPTIAVDLPTEGRFYPEGHPLHNAEFVEIKEMSTPQEEILANESLIKKGIALDKMLQSLFVNKNINLDTLFIGDKNAIAIAARANNYDPIFKTSVTCPSCGAPNEEEFDFQKIEAKKAVEDIKISADGTFLITVPKELTRSEDIKLEMRLLTGKDEKSLRAAKESKKKHNLKDTPIKDLFQKMIVSVNGNDEVRATMYFIEKINKKIITFIKDEYQRVTPNMDLKRNFSCARCGAENVIRIPFNARLFWT